jgi:hypothetical protein
LALFSLAKMLASLPGKRATDASKAPPKTFGGLLAGEAKKIAYAIVGDLSASNPPGGIARADKYDYHE